MSNILYTGETKCVNFLPIQGGCWIFRIEVGGFDKRRSKIQEGLIPPSELCFGTSEIECSASWSNIM